MNHDPGFHLSCDQYLSKGWGPPHGRLFDNLPHAGAIAQIVLHSASDALLLFALWTKTRSVWLALAATLFITTAPYDLALSATLWTPSLASAPLYQ